MRDAAIAAHEGRAADRICPLRGAGFCCVSPKDGWTGVRLLELGRSSKLWRGPKTALLARSNSRKSATVEEQSALPGAGGSTGRLSPFNGKTGISDTFCPCGRSGARVPVRQKGGSRIVAGFRDGTLRAQSIAARPPSGLS